MFIEAIATYIPETVISFENFCESIQLPHAQTKIFSRYHGLNKIPYAKDISYYDLIEKSIRPLLKSIDLTRLKYIVHACVNPIWPLGHAVLANLQEKLGLLYTEIFSVHIHECTSTINAFNILDSLLEQENEDSYAILIASDVEFFPMRGLPRIPVAGDAAAAILVSKRKGHHRLVATNVSSNPQFVNGTWKTEEEEKFYQKMFLSMVEFNFKQCLHKAGLKVDSIQCVLPVNSSVSALSVLAKQLGFVGDRFYTKNIAKTAHCFGADVIINLESALSENLIKKGDYYMMFLIGQSGSFGTAIFQY